MDDACGVRFRESSPHLRGNVDGVVQRQRPFADPLLECLPLVVSHDQIELPVCRFVDLEDSADVGVVERRGGFGFLQKALLGDLVPRQVRW